jgi:type I restriction-modification system DNA methylase subunit
MIEKLNIINVHELKEMFKINNTMQKLISELKIFQQHLINDIKNNVNDILINKKEQDFYYSLLKQKLITKEQFINKDLFVNDSLYNSFLKNYSYFILNRLLFSKIVNDKNNKTFSLTTSQIHKVISDPIICFADTNNSEELILYPSKDVLNIIVQSLSNLDLKDLDGENLGYLYEYFLPIEEKKKLGAYYTESWIIDYIISELNIHKDSIILEPSCGTGAFLSHTYNYLRNLGTEHQDALNNLYGIDINPYVVEISLMTLFLKDPKNINKNKNINLFVLNTLKNFHEQQELISHNYGNVLQINQKFDAILGNPPYGIKFSKEDKKLLSKEYEETWFMKYDSFACFIHYGLNKLKENGRLGFIVPSTFLTIDTFRYLREFILKNCKVISITDLGKGIFDQATVSTVILVIEKCSDFSELEKNRIKFVDLSELKTKKEKEINLYNNKYIAEFSQLALWKNNDKCQFLFKPHNYINVLSKTVALNLICDIKIASRSTEFTNDSSNHKLILSLKHKSNNSKCLLKGRNNKKWVFDSNTNYTNLYVPNNELEKVKGGIYLKDKIIISHTQGNSIVASLDSGQNPWTGDVFILTLLNSSTHYLLEYILGVINSEYMQILHKKLYRDTTPHLIKTAIENFPIPYVNDDIQNIIKNYVLNIINNIDKEKHINLLNNKIEEIFTTI